MIEPEIKEREDKTTKGPWEWDIRTDYSRGNGKKIAKLRSCSVFYERIFNNLDVKKVIVEQESWYVFPDKENRDFISNAREDIPYLLDKIDRIKQVVENAQEFGLLNIIDNILKE